MYLNKLPWIYSDINLNNHSILDEYYIYFTNLNRYLIYTVNLAMLILFYIVSIELIVEFNSGTYVCLLVPHLIIVNDFSL